MAGATFNIDLAVAGASAVDKAAGSLDGFTDKATSAASATKVAAGDTTEAFEEMEDAVKEAAEAFDFRGASRALGKLGGPIGDVGNKIFGAKYAVDKLNKVFGDKGGAVLAAVGFAAVAAAVIAVTAALISGAVATLKWSVGLADANRTQGLLNAGIAGSVAGGDQLTEKIHALGAQVPQTKEELLSMAGELAKTGLKGDALSAALETAAIKAARLKYGPDFAKQTISLTNLSARLTDNVSRIFGGLKIDALLQGFSRLVALFDDTEITGKAIKVVFESIFQPLIDGIVDVIPLIEKGFIQFEIMAVRGLTAIKPYTGVFRQWAPYLEPVWTGIKAIGVVVAALAAVAVAGVALFVAPFVALSAACIYALGVVAGFAVDAYGKLSEFGASVLAFFDGISLIDIGKNLIAGLAAGITSGASAVVDSVGGAVHGAIDAAKSVLGIASPSKVFAEIGLNTAAGMAGGVDTGAVAVQGSLESLVNPPTVKASIGTPAPSAAAGASFHIEINGVKGAEDAIDRIKEAVLQILEGNVSQLGVATGA